jgi:hypothetical protein
MIMQVKIWDPSIRGSELRATLKGHTRCLYMFLCTRDDLCESICADDHASIVVVDLKIYELQNCSFYKF